MKGKRDNSIIAVGGFKTPSLICYVAIIKYYTWGEEIRSVLYLCSYSFLSKFGEGSFQAMQMYYFYLKFWLLILAFIGGSWLQQLLLWCSKWWPFLFCIFINWDSSVRENSFPPIYLYHHLMISVWIFFSQPLFLNPTFLTQPWHPLICSLF